MTVASEEMGKKPIPRDYTQLPNEFLYALEEEDLQHAQAIVERSLEGVFTLLNPEVRSDLADICDDYDVLRWLAIAGHKTVGTEWLDNRGNL